MDCERRTVSGHRSVFYFRDLMKVIQKVKVRREKILKKWIFKSC